mmetsp:Transcript_144446/g.402423  ORF Transcript_144446/g.402423 Transcript_144446/m.402423 type:complete len:183 (-) Transcript_144446:122-670(-)
MTPGSDVVAVFADGEFHAHSLLLRLASPVFEAMFTSSMAEGRCSRFEVNVATKAEFEAFYAWLHPGRDVQVDQGNADAMLKLADYYQVEQLKTTCASVLQHAPPSASRLILADECGLTDWRDQLVERLAAEFDKHDLEPLKSHMDLLMAVVSRARVHFGKHKEELLVSRAQQKMRGRECITW